MNKKKYVICIDKDCGLTYGKVYAVKFESENCYDLQRPEGINPYHKSRFEDCREISFEEVQKKIEGLGIYSIDSYKQTGHIKLSTYGSLFFKRPDGENEYTQSHNKYWNYNPDDIPKKETDWVEALAKEHGACAEFAKAVVKKLNEGSKGDE